MKILILSITLSTSILGDALKDFNTFLNLPMGLEIGRTLRTDLDPLLSSKDGITYFAKDFDAHFDELGFLSKVVLDNSKNHQFPATWNLTWNSSLKEVKSILSAIGNVEIVSRDMSKSPFVDSLNEVVLEIDSHVYHFQVINWKEGSKNKDGLSRIVISAI